MDGSWIVIAVTGIVPLTTGLTSLVFFRSARRARNTLSRMTPASPLTIADAKTTGPVQLTGTAVPLGNRALLTAPLSSKPCLWWRVAIDESNGSSITRLATESDAVDFLLDDASGAVARVNTTRVSVGLTTRNIDPGHEAGAQGILTKLGIKKPVASLLWSEERIDPHAVVCVLGHARPPLAADGGRPFRPETFVRERIVLEAPEGSDLVLSVGGDTALAAKLRADERAASRQALAFSAITFVLAAVVAGLIYMAATS
jgi:hypothetical protein